MILAGDTKLCLLDSSLRRVDELAAGDVVVCERVPTAVTSVTPTMAQLYTVEPLWSAPFTCGGEMVIGGSPTLESAAVSRVGDEVLLTMRVGGKDNNPIPPWSRVHRFSANSTAKQRQHTANKYIIAPWYRTIASLAEKVVDWGISVGRRPMLELQRPTMSLGQYWRAGYRLDVGVISECVLTSMKMRARVLVGVIDRCGRLYNDAIRDKYVGPPHRDFTTWRTYYKLITSSNIINAVERLIMSLGLVYWRGHSDNELYLWTHSSPGYFSYAVLTRANFNWHTEPVRIVALGERPCYKIDLDTAGYLCLADGTIIKHMSNQSLPTWTHDTPLSGKPVEHITS